MNGTTFTMGTADSTLTANWRLTTHNINGNVSWSDQNNKFASRPSGVTVTLSRTPSTGQVTAVPSPITVSGNSSYTFPNVQTYDATTGRAYNYTVSKNQVPGYETTINGYNITNTLILPTYTSEVTAVPVNTFQNKFLKNGAVKVTGKLKAAANNRDSVGLHGGVATFQIDNKIGFSKEDVKITYTNARRTKSKYNKLYSK